MAPMTDRSDRADADGRACRLAGVVVLYHPGEDLLDNVASCAGQVDILFAIDNSEGDTSVTASNLRVFGNVVHVANGRNLGVAAALNRGALLALERRCDYLLTMDQDSRAAPGMVRAMLEIIGSAGQDRVGIVAPFLVTRPGEEPGLAEDCRDMETVMTSGNLLSLRAYEAVGPFMEELFVDFVDMEYCLRLRSRGFRVVRANRALLSHRVGRLFRVSLFGRDFFLTAHSPLRKYYKTRNRFLVADRYRDRFPRFRRADRARFALELLRLLFFEDGKMEKLAMMRKGYSDYRSGRMGRYDDEAGGGRP